MEAPGHSFMRNRTATKAKVKPFGPRVLSEPAPYAAGQDAFGNPSRRALSHCMLAGLIAAALFSPAFAEDTADPIEQGKIDSANDPAEGINREIFEANRYFDDHVLKPAARAFGEDLSPELRQGIHNVATNSCKNLSSRQRHPPSQCRPGLEYRAALRHQLHGRLRLHQRCRRELGRPYHYADLGQTFGVWGLPAGPAVTDRASRSIQSSRCHRTCRNKRVEFLAPPTTIVNAVSYTELGATTVTQSITGPKFCRTPSARKRLERPLRFDAPDQGADARKVRGRRQGGDRGPYRRKQSGLAPVKEIA